MSDLTAMSEQTSPSLLLVEDDAYLSKELVEYLTGEGFAVTSVATVAAAEEALQASFDLLVLDLNLPDGSGVELCERLRPYTRAGIVICSGRSDRELRLSLLRGGADAFLTKPVDPQELSAVLASVLRRLTINHATPLGQVALPTLWRLDRVQNCLLAPMGRQQSLSAAERLLLNELFIQPERTAARQHLLEVFAAAGMPMSGPRLESLVSRLRAKVYASCGTHLPLRASYGRGYVFEAHAEIL